jgi:hypothetical protein
MVFGNVMGWDVRFRLGTGASRLVVGFLLAVTGWWIIVTSCTFQWLVRGVVT